MITDKTTKKFGPLLAFFTIIAIVGVACWPLPGLAKSREPAEKHLAAAPISYIGAFSLSPTRGPAGTVVKATGRGFDPGVNMDLVWQAFQGSWKVEGPDFEGREFKNKFEPLSKMQTDASGSFETSFRVPQGFGFIHDVLVMQDGTIRNKAGFDVAMEVPFSPRTGPLGTPITITATGIGWRPLENSWVVIYDNKFTGWLSAVTTNGAATGVIPAVGAPGKHIIQILHASSTFPYLNMQQSPRPERTTWTFEFTLTDGPPVLPPSASTQALPAETVAPSAGSGPRLWTNPLSGPMGTQVSLQGGGLPPGQKVELLWSRVRGNRVSGRGWVEDFRFLAAVSTGPDGDIRHTFIAPDDLGGPHTIEARINGQKVANTSFNITPSALPIEPASGPAGTNITIHLKGVGWTETANIYTLVYDNAHLGYACGFNSQGDITINLPAAGEAGWHFIDVYPAIYKGKDMKWTNNFRIPQLTYKEDHPGERLPAFHFAFLVTR
jgi:hypothetical protein